ncbi:MAG TPA: rod shape-determining protein MreD [Actinomycetes bacterium]|nr:rod shape-determining protein MreD [Actinomycetes bacterium]
MSASRVLLCVALVLTAAVLQVTVVNRLPLPGAGPDLVLLVVIGIALVVGPTAAASIGFGAGLLVDLMPPTATEVGRWALVFCVVGYLAGQVQLDVRRSVWVVMAAVAGLSAVSVLLFAGLGLLFGDERIEASIVVSATVSTVLYDLLLAPFVIPGVMALTRRTAINSAMP